MTDDILSQDTIFFQSQLYQCEERYHREKKLIQEALERYPNWDYLHQRLAWHERPLFHFTSHKGKAILRLKVEEALASRRQNPEIIPPELLLQHTCITTSVNADYFPYLLQLLDIISVSLIYKTLPIKIIDTGLTITQKNELQKNSQIEIFISAVKEDPKTYPYKRKLHKIFPNHQFYFWFDCDTLIINEHKLDCLFAVMIKQGIALVQHDENDTVFCAHKSFLDTHQNDPIPVINLHDDSILLHMAKYKYPSMVCVPFAKTPIANRFNQLSLAEKEEFNNKEKQKPLYFRSKKYLINQYPIVEGADIKKFNDYFMKRLDLSKPLLPSTQEEILALSKSLQQSWRFQKELMLIKSAILVYPKWKYIKDRLK